MNDNRDLASKSGGMDYLKLARILGDIRSQFNWRERSDRAVAYYDLSQMTESLRIKKEAGMDPVITSLITADINSVLGHEAKMRQDWKVELDSDLYADVGGYFNEKMHEAKRETNAAMHISDAFASQIKAGIGFVKVSRNTNPLEYPYRVSSIHRNRVRWDMRISEKGFDGCRWLIEEDWADKDVLYSAFPEARRLLDEHQSLIDPPFESDIFTKSRLTTFDNESYEARAYFDRINEEWLDNSHRDRAKVYEVHYKVPKTVKVLAVGTSRIKFNKKNPVHVVSVDRGIAEIIEGPGYEVRRSMFIGPYRIYDEPTGTQRYPIVPFWCYQEDSTGAPIGLIEAMISPQDEYNERRTVMRHMLKSKRVYADRDSLALEVNSFSNVADEVMKSDAFIVLNENRRNQNGFRIEDNSGLQQEQINAMESARELIRASSGISMNFSGSSGASQSGIAINSIVEQSTVTLGEALDNYREGTRLVGELLLNLCIDDHQRPDMQVSVGTGKRRRTVVLNSFDERGVPLNHVGDLPVRMGLGEVPATPAHKLQQQQQIAQVLNSVGQDPILRAALAGMFIQSTDIENRDDVAALAYKSAGIPEPGVKPDPNEEQAAQEQQAKQQEMQDRLTQADVAEKEGKAEKAHADAQLSVARAEQIGAQAVGQHLNNEMATQPPPPIQPTREDLANQAIAEAMHGLGSSSQQVAAPVG